MLKTILLARFLEKVDWSNTSCGTVLVIASRFQRYNQNKNNYHLISLTSDLFLVFLSETQKRIIKVKNFEKGTELISFKFVRTSLKSANAFVQGCQSLTLIENKEIYRPFLIFFLIYLTLPKPNQGITSLPSGNSIFLVTSFVSDSLIVFYIVQARKDSVIKDYLFSCFTILNKQFLKFHFIGRYASNKVKPFFRFFLFYIASSRIFHVTMVCNIFLPLVSFKTRFLFNTMLLVVIVLTTISFTLIPFFLH